MAALTGQKVKDSYKDVLQVSNSNAGIDATLRDISDGEGTASALQISTTHVNVDGTFQIGGVTLSTSVAALNLLNNLAAGAVLIGDASGDPQAITAFTAVSGFLKHEHGGIEADISAIADGGMLVGTGAGTMAIRAGALTAGAAGFLKHEVGGLEKDISAIVPGDIFIGSASGAGVLQSLTGTKRTYTKPQGSSLKLLTSSASSVAWDATDTQVARHVMTESTVLALPTGLTSGLTYILILDNAASGASALSFAFASGYQWPGGAAPTNTKTNSARDVWAWVTDGTNMTVPGTNLS